jgi:hypothetical protein
MAVIGARHFLVASDFDQTLRGKGWITKARKRKFLVFRVFAPFRAFVPRFRAFVLRAHSIRMTNPPRARMATSITSFDVTVRVLLSNERSVAPSRMSVI